MKIEVHGNESWLTTEWLRANLAPHEVAAPGVDPGTDAFLFYEGTVIDPEIYTRAPLEKRFGLLTEPSAGRPFAARSLSHVENFRAIFTHDPVLLAMHPKYRQNIFGTSWVFRDEDVFGPPAKSKIMSMIASNLSCLEGHKLRHAICRGLYERKCPVDIFGRNIPWGPFIKDKRDGVGPYMFTVAIENCRKKNYFSEKIIDAFVTRTVPIYWGCPNAQEYFNTDGMIIIHNERQFWRAYERVMADPQGLYGAMRDAMEENFKLAIEKYNAVRAWGNVAAAIEKEIKNGFADVCCSGWGKTKLKLAEQAYLAAEHGFRYSTTPFIGENIRAMINKVRARIA